MAFDGRHRPQRVEINPDHRKNRVDSGNAGGATPHRGQRRFFDVGNVWRHLGPDRNLRDLGHPAGYFLTQVGMFAHLRSHLPFRHPVRTRKIQFESVDPRVLDQTRQFLPAIFAVLFHDRSDEYIVRIIFLNLAKLFQPDFDWPIGNQFDIFEPNHLVVFARTQLAVARHNIDYLARFEADGFRDRSAPAGVVRFCEHARIGSRRAGAQQKGIGEFDSVNGD